MKVKDKQMEQSFEISDLSQCVYTTAFFDVTINLAFSVDLP